MLGDVTEEELSRIVRESLGRPALPQLHDEAVRRRARATAEAQGLLQRIERDLADEGPIGVLPHSRFRDFARTGNRRRYEALTRWRDRRIEEAAIACWLGMDRLTQLQDLLWAECEASSWVMPAHEAADRPIDLRVAMCAFRYARIVRLLGEALDAEVAARVIEEVRRRVLRPYLDDTRDFWWKTHTNNWNAVCNGAVGLAAMLIEDDPDRLTRTLGEALAALPVFLSGFTDDGGCSEGPSYWRFGFGWYADFAAGLHDFTGGRLNLMAGERIERICRYPLAVHVAPGQELTFADAHAGYLSAATAVRINRFQDIPELFGLCELTSDGALRASTLSDLLVSDDRRHRPPDDRRDALLPALGVVKLRAGGLTLGAKAGHNQEHHNHNDVGSFLLHRGRTFFLTDLGAPIYSRRTFSERRYESIFCNSLGHSVPVVDGRRQAVGAEHAGTLAVEGLDGDGAKTVRIEMARAYGPAHLKRLTRTIELAPGGTRVRLADAFAFARRPESVTEAFITTLPAEADDAGRSVTIASEADGTLRLTADAPGRFAVAELSRESAESRAGELVRRVAFIPEAPAAEMTLAFTLEPS